MTTPHNTPFARASPSDVGWSGFLFRFIWAGMCALIAGVMAGTLPLESPQIVLWPVAGIFAYFTGVSIADATLRVPGDGGRLDLLGIEHLLMLVLTGVSILVAVGMIPISLGVVMPELVAPGLVFLAALIGIIGVGFLMGGLIANDGSGEGFLQKWLTSPGARIGLDILSVLGGAATIVYIAQLLA